MNSPTPSLTVPRRPCLHRRQADQCGRPEAKAVIQIRQRLVPRSRTSTGSLWQAETEIDGKTYSATSRHGAPQALARVLIDAGIPDQPVEVRGSDKSDPGTRDSLRIDRSMRWRNGPSPKAPPHCCIASGTRSSRRGSFPLKRPDKKCVSSPQPVSLPAKIRHPPKSTLRNAFHAAAIFNPPAAGRASAHRPAGCALIGLRAPGTAHVALALCRTKVLQPHDPLPATAAGIVEVVPALCMICTNKPERMHTRLRASPQAAPPFDKPRTRLRGKRAKPFESLRTSSGDDP